LYQEHAHHLPQELCARCGGDGVMERFASTLKSCRSETRKAQLLVQALATAA
jgi:hypothetical protein